MKRSVFIGTEAAQELASHVLRYAIESRARDNVRVEYLNRAMANAGLENNSAISSNTPFSKQRLYVPMLAGEGQAAYIDSDMLIFRDVNELFDAAGEEPIACCSTRQAGREPQTAVTVFNVSKCAWDPSEIVKKLEGNPSDYRPYLYEFSFAGGVARTIPPSWNDLEYFDPRTTCLLHFTDMDTQPWVTAANRFSDVWTEALRQTVSAHPEVQSEVEKAVRLFHARPSLLWQSRNDWRQSREIPLLQRIQDSLFYAPPHTLAHGLPFGLGRFVGRFLNAGAPQLLKRSVAFVCCLSLLLRRRRRLLVIAMLLNVKCIINQKNSVLLSSGSASSLV